MKHIKKLRATRLKLGLTQEQLAKKSQVDRSFISLLERGLRNPSEATAVRIERSLDYFAKKGS